MKSLAELALSLCDLLEAEGQVLRENARNLAFGCAVAGIGLIFLAGAAALVAIAVYEGLLSILPMPVCLLILAAFCACIAFAIFAVSRIWLKTPSSGK